jgi:hypothetical protein
MCNYLSCDGLSAIAACVVAILAVLAFVRGLPEYKKQGSQRRATLLLDMRYRFRKHSAFKCICDALDRKYRKFGETCHLDKDDGIWDEVNYGDRWDFINFFEEVALMVNSRLMSDDVAYDMFGYYAISFSEECDSCNDGYDEKRSRSPFIGFVKDDDMKTSRPLFNNFVEKMKGIAEKKQGSNYKFKNTDYRF